jgi:tetratricopeptide (TPR) repeat protein
MSRWPQAGLQAWDLRAEDRSADDLVLLARVLSGRRFHESGGLMPLEAPSFRQDLETLQQKLPQERQASVIDPQAWHRWEAELSRDAGDWSSAVFHLDRLLKLRPNSVADRASRALAFARLGMWQRAAADYGWAIDLGLKDGQRLSAKGIAHLYLNQRREAAKCFQEVAAAANAPARAWSDYALVSLYAGDAAGYRRACAALVERFGNNPSDLEMIQWTCTLGADAVDDYNQVVLLGRPPPNGNVAIFVKQLAFGKPATLYRAGLFAEAVQAPQSAQPLPQLYAAMSWFRLGQRDKAKMALDLALARADLLLHGEPEKDYRGEPLLWRDWLALEMLCQEARTLIEGTAKGKGN